MKTEAADSEESEEIPRAPAKKGVTPSKSPYVGTMYKLEFAGKLVIKVPRGVIDKHVAFAAHFADRHIDLTEMNESQAHILIHYLYTGNYQSLEPEADSPEEKRAKAFAVSLWVYSAAVEYHLEHLAVLASVELTKLGEGLTFPELFRIMDREEYCLGEDEAWLAGYLVKRGERYSEHVTHDYAKSLRAEIGEKRTLVNILIENIVDLKLLVQFQRTLLDNELGRG
ncbi:hypothetical protein N0V84_009815 [Fusarium piperis]|uniref:BTB domain-containing protein n=1 Tax=Fusarium piperis TaxID=1435070 RepID=A0A9W8W5M2_9HYPO|nr:hypothetical protein N0V84_009815 [Fusarium piperis]